jgi:acyl-CoA thioesterase-2
MAAALMAGRSSVTRANFLSLDNLPGKDGSFVAEPERWWVASPRAFGGQLIAHCVVAAGEACARRGFAHAHAAHVHFVAPSRMIRTVYTARALREGRSFALYAVEGVEEQDGRVIVVATVGFQAHSPGGARDRPTLHAAPMPSVPLPESCAPSTMDAWADSKAEGLAQMCWQVRPVAGSPYLCWVSWQGGPTPQPLSDSPVEHAAAIGFLSDLQFLWAAFWPHAEEQRASMITSLDHAIHFHAHAPCASSWLLFQLDSPFAGAERGFVRGHVWDADGTLVASMVQEGVLRVARRSRL